jgi:hypothetical protein
MTKEVRLNAFDMNCIGHIQHGMWTHPRDRSTEYNTIEYWQDLAAAGGTRQIRRDLPVISPRAAALPWVLRRRMRGQSFLLARMDGDFAASNGFRAQNRALLGRRRFWPDWSTG